MQALLIRHAASSGQAANAPLSEEGYLQAQSIAPILNDLGAGPLYASSMTRAIETIEPYALMSYQAISILDDLRERLLSPTPLDDWEYHIRRSFDDPDHKVDGGESHNDLLVRWKKALLTIEEQAGSLPTLVTHGGMTSTLFHSLDPSFGFEDWKALRNPDIFQIEIKNGALVSFARLKEAS